MASPDAQQHRTSYHITGLPELQLHTRSDTLPSLYFGLSCSLLFRCLPDAHRDSRLSFLLLLGR